MLSENLHLTSKKSNHIALRFLILLGVVSLLTDITAKGAQSIIGPYLAILGANAFIVGFVAGLGEFIGYSLRFFSGYLADKTGFYWFNVTFGYLINVVAVPALALAHSWQWAALLIIIERMGKALRTPARDTMLSHAGLSVGAGWGFGLHKMMDQIGCMIGPLIVTVVLYLKYSYQQSFLILFIPAITAFIVLLTARFLYPNPAKLEEEIPFQPNGGRTKLMFYFAGAAFVAAGYADFPLVAFHFNKIAMPDIWIPIIYAIALGASAVTSIVFGYLYDCFGSRIFILLILFSAFFAPFVFLGNFSLEIVGMILWGIGMGAQLPLMRAIIAKRIPIKERGTVFGIFTTGYGIAWFLGSTLMGILYGISIPLLVIFSTVIQLLAIPCFIAGFKSK
ncbi:MAG: MFS transporter [Gammaproteobacteria bacterium]|nr:MFS transporter [Gammaproteobacteria bacterium]